MKSEWFVSPQALSRARLDQLLSQEQLAKKSGVSVRSIRGYEREEQAVRQETLQCLAKALLREVRDIAIIRSKVRAGKGERAMVAAAAPTTASPLPPRTPLETMIDLERASGVDTTPVKTARGLVEILTAKRLQDVFTAYALHDGALFSLSGTVDGMRSVAPSEAALLGSRGGVAARFHIVKEVAPGRPIGVTVHAASAEHTRALLDHHGKAVTLTLRVVLVPGEPQDDGPGFSAFITRISVKRPWTFVVEEVAGASGPEDASEQRKRPRPARKAGKRPPP